MLTFNGMQVTVTDTATAAIPEDKLDWSVYRSPSRAKRRRDRSKLVLREPAVFQLQGRLVMHPRLWDELKKQASPTQRPFSLWGVQATPFV